MYEIRTNKKFRSSYKRIVHSGRFDKEKFETIVEFLKQGSELPTEYYDHALTGNLSRYRECHIRGDILLVYEIDLSEKIVILDNIGNHAQIFES